MTWWVDWASAQATAGSAIAAWTRLCTAIVVRGLLALFIASPSLAAEPVAARPDDFAVALELDVDAAPLQRVVLPLAVHVGAVRTDLGDLRVFAPDGVVVPHGLAAVPRPTPAPPRRTALRPFPLPDDLYGPDTSTRVRIDTDGTIVSVDGTRRHDAARRYLLDAQAALPLRTLEFVFVGNATLDARVTVAAGAELARANPVVAGERIVRSRQGSRELRQLRVRMPNAVTQRYLWLEVAAATALPPLQLVWADTEVVTDVVRGSTGWLTTQANGSEVVVDLGARVPLHSVHVDVGVDGSLLQLELACTRAATDSDGLGTAATWHPLGVHRASRLRQNGNLVLGDAASLGGTACRRLRLRAIDGNRWPTAARVRVDYLPTELWFLGRGAGRYLVAHGNGALAGTAQPVSALRNAAGAMQVAAGRPRIVATRVLGGEARRDERPPLSTDTVVLWAVLVIGVGSVVVLALRVLRAGPRP